MSPEILKEIITTPMPYGKYKGTMIADLPSYYLEWFSTQGISQRKIRNAIGYYFRDKN